MKYRKGFVSNSSSSSFVCDICGEGVSGRDLDLEEAEMYECENGHTFCEKELLKDPEELSFEVKKIILLEKLNPAYYKEEIDKINSSKEEDDDFYSLWESHSELRYELPAELCPLCCFKNLSSDNALSYMYAILKTDKKKLLEEIKSKFKNISEFFAFVKGIEK